MSEDRPLNERPAARPEPNATDHAPPKDSKRGMSAGAIGCLSIVGVLLLAIIITLVVSSLNQRPAESGSSAPDKYVQTWPKSYASTSCAEWLDAMSASQRFAGSADMLTGARHKDGDEGLPPDSMIDEFGRGLDVACVVPSMSVADAAVGLYRTEPRFHP